MISCDVRQGIAIITIDRASKANSLPEEGKRALADRIGDMALDGNVKAIVLTGAGGRSFCAGSDIRQMSKFDTGDMYRMLGHERSMYVAAMESAKPVVAAVNGYALGAGLILAMACDYVVASSNAWFGAPELTIGVSAPLEGLLLPWIVGLNTARSMYFTGRRMDAEEALRSGLVHEIVERGQCVDRAAEVAQQMANLPGNGFAVQKDLLHQFLLSGNLEATIRASRYATSTQFANGVAGRALETFLTREE